IPPHARSILVLLCALLTPAALASSSNSLLDISSDGALLACSNRDSGTVSIIDARTCTKLRDVKVGTDPEGVTFLGTSPTVAVAISGDDVVVFLDADPGQTLARTEVFDEPYGVVSNADGTRAYVTLSYPGQVIEIDTASRAIVRSIDAG